MVYLCPGYMTLYDMVALPMYYKAWQISITLDLVLNILLRYWYAYSAIVAAQNGILSQCDRTCYCYLQPKAKIPLMHNANADATKYRKHGISIEALPFVQMQMWSTTMTKWILSGSDQFECECLSDRKSLHTHDCHRVAYASHRGEITLVP